MSGQGFTLTDAADIFYTDCRARRLTASTLHFYRVTLGISFRYLEAQQVVLLDDVTAHHIRKFLTLRQDAGLLFLLTYTESTSKVL